MVKVVQAYEVVRTNKRAKEVKPASHGKATRDHELHLNELASDSSMKVVPLFVSH
jgi:hypothetical protein